MNVFDIIGPVMIGPSSSHTAGAVRIGQDRWRAAGGNRGKSGNWPAWIFCKNLQRTWYG